MINILVSVRRPFSGKILSGEKGLELRKSEPRIHPENHGGVTLWLYESGKDGERAIIGECQLWCIIPLRRMPNELIIKKACVSVAHLRAYLPCYAWGVQDPVRFPAPVPLSSIGLTRPPQSWQYLTSEQAVILEKAASLTPKTCVECYHWSDWSGECWCSTSGHTWEEMDADHPACPQFKPEEGKEGE